MQNTKKAFTLVELIVVITILAVLGTIAFISLQGYSAEARDSKRVQNINSILSKVNIEVGKGTSLSTLITSGSGAVNTDAVSQDTHDAIINNSGSTTVHQGAVNFLTIKENKTDFMDLDSTQDYPFAYSVGGTGTGAFKFMQIATVSEAENMAIVKGNYYKMNESTDSAGLITTVAGNDTTIVTNEGATLPYSL